jgi:ubiquinone/menaquinone biosynthesis C-methylase UbiE
LTLDELGRELGLAGRPTTVMVTALRAMGLLVADCSDRLQLSELAREHLDPSSPFDMSGYIGFAANSPGVLEMVERLRTNRPGGTKPGEPGAIHIYRQGVKSAMENEKTARRHTLALVGRARTAAPALTSQVDLSEAQTLVDIGGGSGIYSFAFVLKNPRLRAIILDRPQVLKVTAEQAKRYGVTDRIECLAADMFVDPIPRADVALLSYMLQNWDIPDAKILIRRAAAALPTGGRLLVHDVFLNDALDGPLALALFSAQLFCMTEGRVYSAAEHRGWLNESGFKVGPILPTLTHNLGVLVGTKHEPPG